MTAPAGPGSGSGASRDPGSDGTGTPATAHTLLRAHLVATIRDDGPVSRSELSRAIGLPRSTTTALVAELLREGLISETPARSGGAGSGSGRPATLLSL
jgi:predicted ArsR family transcriptional regulator